MILLGAQVGQAALFQAAALRRTSEIVPEVEFKAVDVHDALRWLGRKALIGVTIASDVQGVVTLSLRNATWETVVRNLAHQVDAIYRFDRGWLQIERKPQGLVPPPGSIYFVSYHPLDKGSAYELREAYGTLNRGVALGRGGDVRRVLSPRFRLRIPGQTALGEPAIRSLADAQRAFPCFDDHDLRWGAVGKPTVDVLVSYSRPGAPRRFYHDFWEREGEGTWRLFLRDGVVRKSNLDFRNVPLSRILRDVGPIYGVEFRVESLSDRRVDMDLTGIPLETFLNWLIYEQGFTYRLEGGVYRIFRAEPQPNDTSDASEAKIPFIEFEKTDVRVVLSWLCQKVGVVCRFDPKVKGLVSVSLREALFETVLQQVCRQLDLTYRVGGRVYEILPRDPNPQNARRLHVSTKPSLTSESTAIEAEYAILFNLAKNARDETLFRRLGADFRWSGFDGDAVEAWRELARASQRFAVIAIDGLPEQSGLVERRAATVRYTGRKGAKGIVYRDLWEKGSLGWRLTFREPLSVAATPPEKA